MKERLWGHTVLILGCALLVAMIAIASFPCWRHSRRLGYGMSATAGAVLVFVAIVAISHKADAPTRAGPTTLTAQASDPMKR
jgi:hypothetical protein